MPSARGSSTTSGDLKGDEHLRLVDAGHPRYDDHPSSGVGERPVVRQAARPGAYLRILRRGELGAADEVDISNRPPTG
jgi:hypothetical protein